MSNSPKKKKKLRRSFLEKEEACERRFGPEPGENRVFRLESVEIVEPTQEPMQVFYERENIWAAVTTKNTRLSNRSANTKMV